MQKIHHPYHLWEDWQNGMWRHIANSEEEQMYLKKAIEFTGDAKLYGSWMMKVVETWQISCEHNFTSPSINHQAWVGHAACCMAFGCPEYITRLAWSHLTQKQQDDANLEADEAIEHWMKQHGYSANSKII